MRITIMDTLRTLQTTPNNDLFTCHNIRGEMRTRLMQVALSWDVFFGYFTLSGCNLWRSYGVIYDHFEYPCENVKIWVWWATPPPLSLHVYYIIQPNIVTIGTSKVLMFSCNFGHCEYPCEYVKNKVCRVNAPLSPPVY